MVRSSWDNVTSPTQGGRASRERARRLLAPRRSGAKVDGMANPGELLINVVRTSKPKALRGLNQKVSGPVQGWDCENSRISGEIGLVETEKSVALFPDMEEPLFHGWSRTWQVTRRKGRKKPPRIAAPGGYSRGRSRKAEISGRRSTRRCRSGSRLSAPKCGICVVRAIGGEPRRRPWNRKPTDCVPGCSSKSSSPPPRRAGGYNRS